MGRRRNAADLVQKLRAHLRSLTRPHYQFLYTKVLFILVPPLSASAPSLRFLWRRHCIHQKQELALSAANNSFVVSNLRLYYLGSFLFTCKVKKKLFSLTSRQIFVRLTMKKKSDKLGMHSCDAGYPLTMVHLKHF